MFQKIPKVSVRDQLSLQQRRSHIKCRLVYGFDFLWNHMVSFLGFEAINQHSYKLKSKCLFLHKELLISFDVCCIDSGEVSGFLTRRWGSHMLGCRGCTL